MKNRTRDFDEELELIHESVKALYKRVDILSPDYSTKLQECNFNLDDIIDRMQEALEEDKEELERAKTEGSEVKANGAKEDVEALEKYLKEAENLHNTVAKMEAELKAKQAPKDTSSQQRLVGNTEKAQALNPILNNSMPNPEEKITAWHIRSKGVTEEEQALNSLLSDPSSTPGEIEAARRIFEESQSAGITVKNGGKPVSKFSGVPPRHASADERERYNLTKDGKYNVDLGNGKSTAYEKKNETLNYKSLNDDAADRKVVEKMIDHALKLGYNPPEISGNKRLVKIAQEVLKAKGVELNTEIKIEAPRRGA
jgi:archaellum component FlaC